MENNIEHILVRYPEGDRGFLIPILQEVQEHYGYISSDVVDEIAEFTRVPPGEIYGVASFYSQFRFTKPGKHTVKVCLGPACQPATTGRARSSHAFSRPVGRPAASAFT